MICNQIRFFTPSKLGMLAQLRGLPLLFDKQHAQSRGVAGNSNTQYSNTPNNDLQARGQTNYYYADWPLFRWGDVYVTLFLWD